VAESRTKIVQLEEARKGWQSVVDRNDKLYVDARAGRLKGVTQLVADALLQNDKGTDNVKYINGTNAPNADALRAISAIRFDGRTLDSIWPYIRVLYFFQLWWFRCLDFVQRVNLNGDNANIELQCRFFCDGIREH
jgi:hypothetical protein